MLVPFTAAAMFVLVQDVPRYGEFLPWCESAEVLERNEHDSLAQLNINFQGLKMSLSTRNTPIENQSIKMTLHQGPFKHLVGYWQFSPISDQACKINLVLEYSFTNFVMEKILGQVFGKLADGLVEAFYRRAQSVYGHA